ncbi:MAG TPA: hypothetical protein VMW32_00910 [Bacteroidales bacterium]|nr:hypothetical protein [Bacteroidales bacterium]
MIRKIFAGLVLLMIALWSCNSKSESKKIGGGDDLIIQQEDGTLSLKLEKAACYSNVSEPSSNTAEWNVVISQPGRYKVWLSSATKDTLDLNYNNSVRVSLLDNQLEVNPECDKIVQNSGDVTYPFYRADSYMGSFYISEPGEYSIQVISEKVISKEVRNQTAYLSDDTRLMSVILTPMTR